MRTQLSLCALLLSGQAAIAQSNIEQKLVNSGNVASVVESDATIRNINGELVRNRFPSGAIAVERRVIELPNGDIVNHGAYMQKDESGNVLVSGGYHEGKREGAWQRQIAMAEARQLSEHANRSFQAPFASKASFVNGELSGDWLCSDAEGRIVFVWAYKAGKRHGLSSWFGPDGKVVMSITYNQNLADGPAQVALAKNGKIQDVQFHNGKMLRRLQTRYPTVNRKVGGLKTDGSYLVPTPLNLLSHDWERSTVEYAAVDQNAQVQHGSSVAYYSNGKPELEGFYANGQRVGAFVWWYPNGQKRTVGGYSKDLEHGQWVWWHENGMKKASGKFDLGNRVASWSAWSEDGKLVSRIDTRAAPMAQRQPGLRQESSLR